MMEKIIQETKEEQVVPYQCCPVCHGTGKIKNLSSCIAYFFSIDATCDVCQGLKIIPMHVVNSSPARVSESVQKPEIPLNKKYISGKITGIEKDATGLFEDAEIFLASQGYNPVNPMNLNHDHDLSWHSYMREDIRELCGCHEIYMLSNWTDSKGAIIEHTIAMYLGLKVKYQVNQ